MALCLTFLLAAVFGGVALTKTIRGTNKGETLGGTNSADNIFGRGGNDDIWARGGTDTAQGGPGNDKVYGVYGSDKDVAGASARTPPTRASARTSSGPPATAILTASPLFTRVRGRELPRSPQTRSLTTPVFWGQKHLPRVPSAH